MTQQVAISGFGRIGRSVLRAWLERADTSEWTVTVINEPADPEAIALLTRYDSNYGRLGEPVSVHQHHLQVGEHRIRLLPGLDPSAADWGALGVDLVLDCTGLAADRAAGEAHLNAGAHRVLFSQPGTPDLDLTAIRGFNDSSIEPHHRLLSAGSCTTNCLIPLLSVIDQQVGVVRGATTTLHAAMNDQPVGDTLQGDERRRTRSALNAFMPIDTALGRGVERLMPALAGRIDCLHMRLPTTTVSAMDLTLVSEGATSADAINQALIEASEQNWRGLIGVCEDPVSSVDFSKDPHSGVVDLTQTRVIDGHLIKLICWFDNEWGFANRMVDLANHLARMDRPPAD